VQRSETADCQFPGDKSHDLCELPEVLHRSAEIVREFLRAGFFQLRRLCEMGIFLDWSFRWRWR